MSTDPRPVSTVALDSSGRDPIDWKGSNSPMILVRNGVPTYANSRVTDKRAMVASWQDGDLLLLAWAGRYKTDVFVVDDIPRARQGLQ